MTDETAVRHEARLEPLVGRNDRALLLAALASNGGGIDSERYPEAARKRLMRAGLLQWKPNQRKSGHYAMLMTLTAKGAALAKALTPNAQAQPTAWSGEATECRSAAAPGCANPQNGD